MCTGIRFTSTSGSMYFGRNLDWTQGYGERVVVTPPAAEVPAAFERPSDLDSAHAHTVIGMGIVAGSRSTSIAATMPALPLRDSTSRRARVMPPMHAASRMR